jgi:hypothetical protein
VEPQSATGPTLGPAFLGGKLLPVFCSLSWRPRHSEILQLKKPSWHEGCVRSLAQCPVTFRTLPGGRCLSGRYPPVGADSTGNGCCAKTGKQGKKPRRTGYEHRSFLPFLHATAVFCPFISAQPIASGSLLLGGETLTLGRTGLRSGIGSLLVLRAACQVAAPSCHVSDKHSCRRQSDQPH